MDEGGGGGGGDWLGWMKRVEGGRPCLGWMKVNAISG